MEFVVFLQTTKSVDQSGWYIGKYIDATNNLWMAQHGKPFKHKKSMAVLTVLPKCSMESSVEDE